jgi:serine/threonine protein kinase
MHEPKELLDAAAKAVLAGLGGGPDPDLSPDALPAVARDLWDRWGSARPASGARRDIEDLARMPAPDYRAAVDRAVAAAGGGKPPSALRAAAAYLTAWPAHLRRSLRRPSDPTGATVPPGLPLGRAADLLPLLPPRLPRFRPGDRPLPGVPWELERLLGVGGFGEVWKARNPALPGLAAALKFCLDAGAASALRNEARLLERIVGRGPSPGIVTLRQAYLAGDPPCLEYEFIDGPDLADLILRWHRGGPPEPAKAARVALHLARALGPVHRLDRPVVHRDLKPANVLTRRASAGHEFLIADFGIGGIVGGWGATAGGRTAGLTLLGAHTPLYASPEQVRCEAADPRDDVYALGVVWFQALTGDLAAGAPTGRAWLADLGRRGMAPGLIDLLAACVEPRAADRPADAAAVAADLTRLLSTRQPTVKPPTAGRADEVAREDPEPPPRRTMRRRAETERPPRVVRPHRGKLISTLGLISILVPFPVGPVAWMMGNLDLAEMEAGRVDPDGEAATRAGRDCGKVATLIYLGLLAVGLVVGVILLIAVGFPFPQLRKPG